MVQDKEKIAVIFIIFRRKSKYGTIIVSATQIASSKNKFEQIKQK